MNFSVRKSLMPVFTTVLMSMPTKFQQATVSLSTKMDVFEKTVTESVFSPKPLTEGLREMADTNFVGGITKKFDDESLKLLKARLMSDTTVIKYVPPLADCKGAYTEPFGYFGAKRPGGRKHQGLDIFVSKFAKKPKNPVIVVAPLDGVVISVKHARKSDNVIANSVVMLGRDGKRYAFDHLANKSDYPKNIIELPKLGDYLHAGDSIGIVGRTGETALWHLHFVVMTDEEKSLQLASKSAIDMAKRSKYTTLKGQVNPLDYKKAGEIANVLKNSIKY